ncbi:hypothetical protein [Micromonospora sp. DH14]|uniref:hypothetical protein n=1 Tax=Micromonospora sp. DH14 TaxID=3040120 RepID=UPI0024435FB6|nr:hypothetical protein [Micromonospora sp. DH14]MDG9675842.1 hypothetical protein [Micromonospora sp. DH14]
MSGGKFVGEVVNRVLVAGEVAGGFDRGRLEGYEFRHHGVVRNMLFDVTRNERRAAVKAFRQLPSGERREAIRRAGHRELHPDPAVARVMEQWSRAVLRRAWWNKLPGWAQPAACVTAMVIGSWLGAGVVVIPGGLVALMIGLVEWNTRRAARLVVSAAPAGSTDPLKAV